MNILEFLNKGLEKQFKYNQYQDEEKLLFEEYLKDPSKILLEMACIRGVDIKVEKIPFSFYFSNKEDVYGRHGIRAKVQWSPIRIRSRDADGYLELHGDYDYISGSHKYKPTGKELTEAREFFKKYKILFAAVWEDKLHQNDLQHYFEGSINWKELLSKFDGVGEKGYYNINHCNSLEELEACVRKHKLFNLND